MSTNNPPLDSIYLGILIYLLIYLFFFCNSNKGDKVQTFQSCSSIRDDPQFSVQLANKICCESDDNGSHQQNRSLSIDEMLLHSSLLAPGMEINPQQAKQVIVELRAK